MDCQQIARLSTVPGRSPISWISSAQGEVGRLMVLVLVLGLVVSVEQAGAASPGPDTTRVGTSAFDPEAGRLLRRFLGPDAYGANQQNWDATQDSEGRLYVANSDGVLIYNGHSWRSVPTANRTAATSVATDDEGRVFVGTIGDFGVLRPDSVGRKQYRSLLDDVPERHRSFKKEIKRTQVTEEGVYFQSDQRLFRWTPETKTMRVWHLSGTEFQHGSVVRDTFFVNVTGKGLMAVDGDSLRLVSGGDQLADRSVRFLLSHGDGGLLVGTFRGLMRREEASFRSFSTDADGILREAWLYAGRRLSDGTIAIGTIDHGLLLFAPDGTLRRHVEARGKPVTGLYEDREGGLWALLDGGMIRYDVGAPFSEFDRPTGVEGIVVDLARHEDALYAATTEAIYRLRTSAHTLASFERVSAFRKETSNTPSWTFHSIGEDLLVGTVHGLARQRSDGTVEYLFRGPQVFDLLQSPVDPSRIYVGTEEGVRVVTHRGTEWTDQGKLLDLTVNARMLAQDEEEHLWVGARSNQLYRIRGLAPQDSAVADRFGAAHGLPKGAVGPYRWQGEVAFGTGMDVLRFAASGDPPFSPDPSLERPPIGMGGGLLHVQTDARGRTWGTTGQGPGRWLQNGGTWRWRPGPLHRLRGDRVGSIAIEDGGRTVWFGMWEDRIVRYVPGSGWPREPVPPLIHSVYAHETDSLLAANGTPERPRVDGGVRLTYGTPSLVDPDEIEYQYKMTGQDAEWSDWTARTEQTYRRLGPGDYTFAVRARLAYGDTTETARYGFTVLPPWYRTWWAYGLYLLAALGLLAGVVHWRTRHLRRRQEALEAAVAERTEEIEWQKEQLADQAERLQELDEAKTRFFANVSHEFRTPLTLILGPVQDLRTQVRRHLSTEAVEHLNVVERNAQRLLRLVDQILGIARMDAGTYELDARPIDLRSEMQRIAQTFEPLADRSNLTLVLDETDGTEAPNRAPVYVDQEALEHVLGNLLSNAIKFTPEGGTITVGVTEQPDAVTLAVADTGPGIPETEQDAIFDRFEQVDGTSTRSQEGAGIGLAFVSDLVDLHGGTIEVESTEGEGTTFSVRFPRGRAHLADVHYAESPDEASAPAVVRSDGGEVSSTAAPSPDRERSSSGGMEKTPGSQAEDLGTGKRRVLVVEDNADVRTYMRSILEPHFSVLEARDGEEGVTLAREELPDVILVDVMMPEMGGHEVTRHLKADPETEAIPLIMVTARAGTDDEVEGLRIGADDYVTKPFDANVLRQRVGGVISLQERLRERLRAEGVATADDVETDDTHGRPEIERRARAAIREHLTDPDFDVSALADELAMSRSSLYRAFEKVETTPSALITEVRMERATTLLREQEGTVTQVAYAVGFDQLSSFSRTFREYAGQSPSRVGESVEVG